MSVLRRNVIPKACHFQVLGFMSAGMLSLQICEGYLARHARRGACSDVYESDSLLKAFAATWELQKTSHPCYWDFSGYVHADKQADDIQWT